MLVYVGIPALLVLVITGLAMLGDRPTVKRYRPGRPFDFTPVWFLSSPQQPADPSGRAELTGGEQRAIGELESATARRPQGATGGASDRW